MKTKIFGREPAVWVSVIEATLFLIVTNGLNWSQEQTGVVMAVVVTLFGVYTAYVTKDTMLGVLTGLTKAVFTLLLTFGVNIQADNMAAILGFVTVITGFFQRTQTSPLENPSWDSGDPEYVGANNELPEDNQHLPYPE